MQLSVTAVTSHRFLGKALGRLNTHITTLKQAVESVELEAEPESVLMMTLMDRPVGHFKEIPNSDGILQYEVGYQTDLSLKPRDSASDDPILLNNIVDGFQLILDECRLTAADHDRLQAAFEGWKAQHLP